MSLDATGIATLLASVGGVSGLLASLRFVPELRRLQADTRKVEADVDLTEQGATAQLVTTALAQLKAAVDQAEKADARAQAADRNVDRLRRELSQVREDCEGRVDDLERQINAYREAAQVHVAWDVQRIMECQRVGLPAPPDAPPLLPRLA